MLTMRARSTALGLLAAGGLALGACHELPGGDPGPASLVAEPVPLVLAATAGGNPVSGIVTITNEGDQPTGRLLTADPSSPNLAVDDDCEGVSLAPEESCTIEVTYTPEASGESTVRWDFSVVSLRGASVRVYVEARTSPVPS